MNEAHPGRRRWSRSQRFVLAVQGVVAEQEYRSMIVASRATEGRASFDSARRAWAERFGVHEDDGLYLGEIQAGRNTRAALIEALDTCGKGATDATAALSRLADAGLIAEA